MSNEVDHIEQPNDKCRAILFLLSTLRVGGSERKIVRIANELAKKQYDVHIAYLNQPSTLLDELDNGIPVICLEREGKYSINSMMRLGNYVRANDIDSIVCVNLYPVLYASAIKYLNRGRKIECIVLINTTEHISRKERYQMVLYTRLLRRSDKVIFGCDYQLRQWKRKYHLGAIDMGFIHNGVDVDWFSEAAIGARDCDMRVKLGIGATDFVVGTVGQLTPKKQQSDFIKAISKLIEIDSGVRGIIVGEGPERFGLERLAREYGVEDNVIFMGEMVDVRPVLAVLDVFVLTSIGETFSNAALEAMSMSRPVILSNVGGAGEMVWDGRNGYLYEKRNVGELTDRLLETHSGAEERRRMGREARRIAVEKFSFPDMVKRYEDVLNA